MKPKRRDVESHENKKVYAILNKYLEEENLPKFQKTLLRFDKWDKQKVIRNVEVLYGSTVKRMVWKQNLIFLKYLIDTCSADINVQEDGITPLWVAFNNRHIKLVIYLIDKGARLQSLYNNRHLLFEACKRRHLHLVEYILRRGKINVNMEDDDGKNCAYDLYLPKCIVKGIKAGRKKIPPPSRFLLLLLEKGLDPNHINNMCEPLLKFVIDRRNLPSLRLLEKYGANLNESVPKIPAIVHAAMKANGRKVVDHMLECEHIYNEDKVYAANTLALQVTGEEQVKYFLKAIEIRNKHWPDFDYANYNASNDGPKILYPPSKKEGTTEGGSGMEASEPEDASINNTKRKSLKKSEESEEDVRKVDEEGKMKEDKADDEDNEGVLEEDRIEDTGKEKSPKSGGGLSGERKRKKRNELQEISAKKICSKHEDIFESKGKCKEKAEELQVEDQMKESKETEREDGKGQMRKTDVDEIELVDSKIWKGKKEEDSSDMENREDFSDEEDEVIPIFPNVMKETMEEMIEISENPLQLKLYIVEIAAYIWDQVFKIDFGPTMRNIQKLISDQVRMGKREFMFPLLKAFTIRYEHCMLSYMFHPALKEVTSHIKENGCDEKVFELSVKLIFLIWKHIEFYEIENFHFTPLWECNQDRWEYELEDSSHTLKLRLIQLINVMIHHRQHERPEFCQALSKIIKSSEKTSGKEKTMSLVHSAVLQARAGGTEILKLLLRLGASPNILDENGQPPVCYAASVFAQANDYNGHNVSFPLCKEIIDLLLKYGAHMDYCGVNGRNALDLLANSGFDVCEVKYTTLQCLAARKLHDVPEDHREVVPKHLEEFVSRHDPTPRDYIFMSDILELLDLDLDMDSEFGDNDNDNDDTSSNSSNDNNHYDDNEIDAPPYVGY